MSIAIEKVMRELEFFFPIMLEFYLDEENNSLTLNQVRLEHANYIMNILKRHIHNIYMVQKFFEWIGWAGVLEAMKIHPEIKQLKSHQVDEFYKFFIKEHKHVLLTYKFIQDFRIIKASECFIEV